jgi:transcriptional regulator
MYVPEHFRENRTEVMHELIRARPLGAMVVLTANGLEANHTPFEIDPHPLPYGTLRGHVARSNPVWNDFLDMTEALVIFQGAETYISPSWYPTKLETGKVVPTWNYIVVHAYGSLKFIEDKIWLRQFIEDLTDRHESQYAVPWKVSDAPEGFTDRMLERIVGMEIVITRLIGKWKASQNRPAADREGVMRALGDIHDGSAREMAEVIRLGEKKNV